jgi:hypothetical protein
MPDRGEEVLMDVSELHRELEFLCELIGKWREQIILYESEGHEVNAGLARDAYKLIAEYELGSGKLTRLDEHLNKVFESIDAILDDYSEEREEEERNRESMRTRIPPERF